MLRACCVLYLCVILGPVPDAFNFYKVGRRNFINEPVTVKPSQSKKIETWLKIRWNFYKALHASCCNSFLRWRRRAWS